MQDGNETATAGQVGRMGSQGSQSWCGFASAPGRSRTCDRDATALSISVKSAPQPAFHGFGLVPEPPKRSRKRSQVSNELATDARAFNSFLGVR